MHITRYCALTVSVVLVGSLIAAADVGLNGQEGQGPARHPDLSGRWQLNRELSENAREKLDQMQSSQGHGPGRHGLGGLFGRLLGSGDIEEARRTVLNAPLSFTLSQDGDRIVLTAADGRARILTANGRKEKVNGRDVVAKWDGARLVSETSFDGAKVTDTYERSRTESQLIVTTRMDMRGHGVSVRRMYEPENLR